MLENHGYLLADAAIRAHMRRLVPGEWPAARPPHPAPEWFDEDSLKRQLKDSDKLQFPGRL